MFCQSFNESGNFSLVTSVFSVEMRQFSYLGFCVVFSLSLQVSQKFGR